MKAWVGRRGPQGPRYELVDLPRPEPRADEVLLRVRAAGLNLVDRFPKPGHFDHSPPAVAPIPGLEAAGEITAIGGAVRDHRVGERVTAMLQGGCAEYACANEALLMPVPGTLDWASAAAVPVSFLTAHDALEAGRFVTGGSVLILGVTTGVGLAAAQLARRRGAALIAGTSRSTAKLEHLGALGPTLALSDAESIADRVLAATAGRGVDVVVDLLGARTLPQALRAASVGGRIVQVGRFAGTRAEVDLELLSMRRLSLLGVSFRTRTLEEHAAIVRGFQARHGADLESGAIAPLVDRVFGFYDLPAAIERASRGEQLGKLVLAGAP